MFLEFAATLIALTLIFIAIKILSRVSNDESLNDEEEPFLGEGAASVQLNPFLKLCTSAILLMTTISCIIGFLQFSPKSIDATLLLLVNHLTLIVWMIVAVIVIGSDMAVYEVLLLKVNNLMLVSQLFVVGYWIWKIIDLRETFLENKIGIAHSIVSFILVPIQLISCYAVRGRATSNGSESSILSSLSRLKLLIPFLWPNGRYLQGLVVACYFLLILGRFVNVMVPLSYKRVIDDLTVGSVFPLTSLIIYTLYRFMQGGVGLLTSLQNFLWIPVGQYTTREVSVRMLEHLHSLSFEFHINRKTGEVLRVIDRGTSSIGSLLSYIFFNIIPVFVDIGIAVVVFVWMFDWTLALIVFITMVTYIFFTVWITEWRTKFRREMNELDTASRGRAVDSLLNFETVKYYGNEAWEVADYEKSISEYQKADWKSNASLNLLNTAQNVVITTGLFCGLWVSAMRVSIGTLTIGDFVAFITYILQLYQPLNWFGTYYRAIQQNMIDMEKMLDLLESNESIKDSPGATELTAINGCSIKFENVCFSYDQKRTALENITFSIPAGKKVALVGSSGGGKSTILRLLFRFYDAQSGRILIDGQDIKLVTQKSLRQNIGVVPQDTVLFNDTIEFNIRYGNFNASEEEIIKVAQAAQIHDRIIAFPEGYKTKVGERGLRLSGGEKQRVAIARTFLKNPPIILFDEATSALDNATELRIQESFQKLCKNRTTLVVAHRLTTVVDADEILVLNNGKIVERGSHEDLLSLGNFYYQMWMRQSESESEE